MEQNTTATTAQGVDANTTTQGQNVNDAKAKKAADKAAKAAAKAAAESKESSFVSTPVTFKVGKDDTQTELHTIDYSNFPKSIGIMLNVLTMPFEFRFLNKLFKVPALTANNSNPERAAIVFKQLVAHFFPAEMERTVKIAEDTKEGIVLLSMKKAGFRFTTLCKAEVGEAVNIWTKNKKAKVSLAVASVRLVNAETIAQTKVIAAATKTVKEKYVKAVTGYEGKYVKLLNNIQE